MPKNKKCPVCGEGMIHLPWAECAGAHGDTWVCKSCKKQWKLDFDGTLVMTDLREEGDQDDIL